MSKQTFSRKLIVTEDGSHTLYIPELNEHYHSIHGAVQESNHIFIKAGFQCFSNISSINILEIGLGTGLNAFLTCVEAKNKNIAVNYTSIEKYPITIDEINELNYVQEVDVEEKEYFRKIHTVEWETFQEITVNFRLRKVKTDIREFTSERQFDLVYFDAFGPDIQPQLWTADVFKQMFSCMSKAAVLVTYSAKGQVRRNMQAAGFIVERIPGPPGKREMLRASVPD